jgi:hypothetical protein
MVRCLDPDAPGFALLGLVRRYGAARVEQACALALEAEMLSVYRLRTLIEVVPSPTSAPAASTRVGPIARYLRPPEQYRLVLVPITRKENPE